eukprot:35422-Pyramimonas_sp.AAC.1
MAGLSRAIHYLQYNAIQFSGAIHLQHNCPKSIAPPPFQLDPLLGHPNRRQVHRWIKMKI